MGDEVKLYSSSVLVSSATVMTGETLCPGGNDSMAVLSGGTAENTTIESWGMLLVSCGGTVNNTAVGIEGMLSVASGGTATGITASAGAYLGFAVAPDTYIQGTSNGSAFEIKDAKISGYTVACGYLQILDGGVAENTTVADGSLKISSGGTASGIMASAGAYLGFAVAPDTYIQGTSNGSAFEMKDAKISGYTISSGYLDVCDGGTANNITIDDGGCLYVSSGGTAWEIKENGGYVEIDSDADVTFVANSFSGLELNMFKKATLHSGTTANSTTVNSYGMLYVSSGGVADDTVLNSGGSMVVSEGGAANSTIINGGSYSPSWLVVSGGVVNSTTINDDGELMIFSGGTANCTAVNDSGCLLVSEGGVVTSTDVNAGGGLHIYSGGVTNRTTVNALGYLGIGGNGTISGTLQIEDGAVVSAYSGAIIDFTVAEQEAPDTALISNWSLISGGADVNYTITVHADQSNGTYLLANGAADFAKTIMVKDTSDTTLGTLDVGETKEFSGASYTLAESAGELSLTITGAVAANAKSDVDGNNISDVMFQYTGGDYQIGFWMNGSSTWQGTGVAKPQEWELLGAYDMDTNGKADQVMFGNVLGGAYIGYYKDGETTDNGWVTIGYLNNPDGVKWDNVIGNVTGNDGKNSIVWHAAELNACGVWTDGTTEWVSITGGFDASWSLQGCGDFTGDGKDEILWQHDGALYTTDIDSNFASLGDGWGDEWQVRAIGDFSGDGKDDIILFHEGTGSVVKFANGQSSAWESLGQLDASDWFIVGAGDYNNDQKDDLLVRQYSTGMLGYYSAGDMSKWNEMGRGVDMNWKVIA